MNDRQLRLNVVLYKEGEYWVGHCIELDILTSGTDREQVYADTQYLCVAQICYAMHNDSDFSQLFRPPSAELTKMVATATQEGQLSLHINRCEQQADLILTRLAA